MKRRGAGIVKRRGANSDRLRRGLVGIGLVAVGFAGGVLAVQAADDAWPVATPRPAEPSRFDDPVPDRARIAAVSTIVKPDVAAAAAADGRRQAGGPRARRGLPAPAGGIDRRP